MDTTRVSASTLTPAMRSSRHHTRRWIVIVVVAALAGGLLVVLRPFGGRASTQTSNASTQYPTSLATATAGALSSQIAVAATLGYVGNYAVVSEAPGILTSLPSPGQVITAGHALYAVDGVQVVLLYGSTPMYRVLAAGTTGADVAELNAALIAVGAATRAQLDPTSETFGAATASAVERLQARLGLQKTGRLAPGSVVFLPSAARITTVLATLGGPAGPGQVLIQATSTTHEVVIPLDPAQQTEVKVGDRVSITLPDGTTTPGTISRVATVVTQAASNAGGTPSIGSSSGSSNPSIEVDVAPTDAAALGSLDQAPVQVSITIATVSQAVIVPVDALLATASGGYAVEVVSGGAHRLVPVSLGLFDDASGMVQISGSVEAGQQVVVPQI